MVGKCTGSDPSSVSITTHAVIMEEDEAGQEQGRAGKGKKAFV